MWMNALYRYYEYYVVRRRTRCQSLFIDGVISDVDFLGWCTTLHRTLLGLPSNVSRSGLV